MEIHRPQKPLNFALEASISAVICTSHSILRLAGDKRLAPCPMHGPLIMSRYLIFLVVINFECSKAPKSMLKIDMKTGW